MNVNDTFKASLNEFYTALTAKAQSLMKSLMPLVDSTLLMSMSYVIKHYIRNMYKLAEESPEHAEQHSENYYPIPVISLGGLCDVEVDTDAVSVFTRLKRVDMLRFDFSELAGYSFKAYGYGAGSLVNFCDNETTPEDVKEHILGSNAEVVDFYFDFHFDTDEGTVFALVKKLRNAGFFF